MKRNNQRNFCWLRDIMKLLSCRFLFSRPRKYRVSQTTGNFKDILDLINGASKSGASIERIW